MPKSPSAIRDNNAVASALLAARSCSHRSFPSGIRLGERRAWVVSEHGSRVAVEAAAQQTTYAELASLAQAARRWGLVVLPEDGVPAALGAWTLAIPRAVSLVIDLRKDEATFLASLRGERRTRVRSVLAQGFGYEILHDPAWASEFHRRYHEPSIRSRHGAEGFVMPAAQLAQAVATGGTEFLRILRNHHCVGAGTCRRDGTRYPWSVSAGWTGTRPWSARGSKSPGSGSRRSGRANWDVVTSLWGAPLPTSGTASSASRCTGMPNWTPPVPCGATTISSSISPTPTPNASS